MAAHMKVPDMGSPVPCSLHEDPSSIVVGALPGLNQRIQGGVDLLGGERGGPHGDGLPKAVSFTLPRAAGKNSGALICIPEFCASCRF